MTSSHGRTAHSALCEDEMPRQRASVPGSFPLPESLPALIFWGVHEGLYERPGAQ